MVADIAHRAAVGTANSDTCKKRKTGLWSSQIRKISERPWKVSWSLPCSGSRSVVIWASGALCGDLLPDPIVSQYQGCEHEKFLQQFKTDMCVDPEAPY